jgi:hypothetical protein
MKVNKHTQSIEQVIIQFNSYLFMCKLNSSEANYKVSTGKEEEKIHIQRKYKKQGNYNNNNNNNNNNNIITIIPSTQVKVIIKK